MSRRKLSGLTVRAERDEDHQTIRDLTYAAFKPMAYSDDTEAEMIDGLRSAGALTLSLVAELNGELVGHVAFSPITVNDEACNWFVLGPVAARTDLQRRGIGSTLIHNGLARLKAGKADGCVVVGDPDYYQRFGFRNDARLTYARAPARNFMILAFQAAVPQGEVHFHPAFGEEA